MPAATRRSARPFPRDSYRQLRHNPSGLLRRLRQRREMAPRTVASFLTLTEKVRVWNKCQVKAKILPEDQLAEKFKDLVIRMGEVAENKLQITTNNAVMQTMVRKGSASRTIVFACRSSTRTTTSPTSSPSR